MADLGDLVGSLMVGLIRARRMADEQTAVLAEYYKTKPLLEGLSVPRIRVPELTIEMPVMIEGDKDGQPPQTETLAGIRDIVANQLKTTLAEQKIETKPKFLAAFKQELTQSLKANKELKSMPSRETFTRQVQSALVKTMSKTNTTLTPEQQKMVAKDLRAAVTANAITREAVPPSIIANFKTAEVKEKASATTVVRLRITMKEEGLEWTTQAGEAGGTIRTLTPE
jgi:hypothetical protein